MAQGNDDAVGRWLETATRLVESFRSTKQLFPYDFRKKFVGVARKRYNGKKKKKERDVDAEADQMADRLQDTIGSFLFASLSFRPLLITCSP